MCTSKALQQGSMGATFGSAIGEANAIGAQGKYTANLYNQQANMLEQQAVSAGQRGAYEQSLIRQQGKQLAGTQKAVLAANGLDIQAGTPLDILASTARGTAEDEAMSEYNTNLQMWGLGEEAKQQRAQAEYAKKAAKYQKTAALLKGFTNLATQYASFGG